jgi:hypothetical protein
VNNKLDHYTIGADSLDQGIEYLSEALDVEILRGGKHVAMSRHNCVARVGVDNFLELIAIDPEAGDPGRIRWFSLDDKITKQKLLDSPQPLCWVVRTDNLDEVIANSPIDLGEVVLFTRGDRSWRLTVPSNGSLPWAGLIPAFIEWSPGPHPSSAMQEIGITLDLINLGNSDPDRLKNLLKALGVDHLASVKVASEPSLGFSFRDKNQNLINLGFA